MSTRRALSRGSNGIKRTLDLNFRSMTLPDSTPSALWTPPAVPGWAIPRRPVTSDAEAAFMAGSALNSLDNLARANPPWAGAWRQRLALKCAAAAVSLAGRTEDEAALRDAWHLRQPGDAPGPAGAILAAWRGLASRSPTVDAATVRSAADLLGIRWSDDLAEPPERFELLAQSDLPAPIAAAAAVTAVQMRRPDAGLIAWWLADQVLALRMRWPLPVPLLMAQAASGAFRATGSRARIRPGGEGFQRAVCVALALGAAEACRLAGDIAGRAGRLQAAAPKLRAKGAREAIALLLDDDAVPGALQTKTLSRWGARRLFERLVTLGAVRELSGRPTFRLYGL